MAERGYFSRGAENSLACIFSLQGHELSDREAALFREADPLGFILFGRNVESPAQLTKLVGQLKDAVGRDCPVMIDQEGGRVQRLGPPHWPVYPAMKPYGDLFGQNQQQAKTNLQNDTDRLCGDLRALGINIDCAPVMDVLTPTTHAVIGDRSFSEDPKVVAMLGEVACERFLRNGITPIIKHIPGHGRAVADSHLELPVVEAPRSELEKTDFYPFKAAAGSKGAEALWAMTAHIVYSDIDPDMPATLSTKVIEQIIRGFIGFEGILIGDDLDMKALAPYGTIEERCVKTLAAGCDLALYCWADLVVMEKIAENCPKLRENTLKRLQTADQLWESAA